MFARVLLLSAVAAVAAGCDTMVVTKPGMTLDNTGLVREDKRDTTGVYVCVFRDMLGAHDPALPAYLSTGKDGYGNLLGVSDDIVRGLADMRLNIVSANLVKPTKLGEGVMLDKTNEKFYVVLIKNWENIDHAIASAVVIQGGVPVSSYTMRVKRDEGKWAIAGRTRP
jgi:hypothetical protein